MTNTPQVLSYEVILSTVRQWSIEQRVALLHDVLETIQPLSLSPQSSRKAGSARDIIIIKTDFDAPLADFREYSE